MNSVLKKNRLVFEVDELSHRERQFFRSIVALQYQVTYAAMAAQSVAEDGTLGLLKEPDHGDLIRLAIVDVLAEAYPDLKVQLVDEDEPNPPGSVTLHSGAPPQPRLRLVK